MTLYYAGTQEVALAGAEVNDHKGDEYSLLSVPTTQTTLIELVDFASMQKVKAKPADVGLEWREDQCS